MLNTLLFCDILTLCNIFYHYNFILSDQYRLTKSIKRNDSLNLSFTIHLLILNLTQGLLHKTLIYLFILQIFASNILK